MGAGPRVGLVPGRSSARQAPGRPRASLLDGAGADPDIGGPPDRLGAASQRSMSACRGPPRADRGGDASSEERAGAPGRTAHPDQTRVAAQDTAQVALTAAGSARWLAYEITETVQESFRQENGPTRREDALPQNAQGDLHPHLHGRSRQVAYDAATDGCFPFGQQRPQSRRPRDPRPYRYQPNLERRHHQLKSVLAAARSNSISGPHRSARMLRLHRAADPVPDRARATCSDDPREGQRAAALPRRPRLQSANGRTRRPLRRHDPQPAHTTADSETVQKSKPDPDRPIAAGASMRGRYRPREARNECWTLAAARMPSSWPAFPEPCPSIGPSNGS